MNDGRAVTHRDILMSLIIPECLDLASTVYRSRKRGRKIKVRRQRIRRVGEKRTLPAPEPWALEWAAEERSTRRW